MATFVSNSLQSLITYGVKLQHLSLTNSCIALYCILLYIVVLGCSVLLIYCYVDIIQYNAMHKFVGVLDNALNFEFDNSVSDLKLEVELCMYIDFQLAHFQEF